MSALALVAPPCSLCGPGYRIGDDGCRHTAEAQARPKAKRGTSNGNASGNAEDRRRRRAWLIETYRADVDAIRVVWTDHSVTIYTPTTPDLAALWAAIEPDEFVQSAERVPACRCYRCGRVLVEADDPHDPAHVTVDRIKPGCQGGTYRRDNIRPACGSCNSETGGGTRRKARR